MKILTSNKGSSSNNRNLLDNSEKDNGNNNENNNSFKNADGSINFGILMSPGTSSGGTAGKTNQSGTVAVNGTSEDVNRFNSVMTGDAAKDVLDNYRFGTATPITLKTEPVKTNNFIGNDGKVDFGILMGGNATATKTETKTSTTNGYTNDDGTINFGVLMSGDFATVENNDDEQDNFVIQKVTQDDKGYWVFDGVTYANKRDAYIAQDNWNREHAVEISQYNNKNLEQAMQNRKEREVAKNIPDNDRIGQYGEGNIDLYDRPVLFNSDGTISTVGSISIEEDGTIILIPTIVEENGKAIRLTDEQAIERYRATKQYLGKFDTQEEADRYADSLHVQQSEIYSTGEDNNPYHSYYCPTLMQTLMVTDYEESILRKTDESIGIVNPVTGEGYDTEEDRELYNEILNQVLERTSDEKIEKAKTVEGEETGLTLYELYEETMDYEKEREDWIYEQFSEEEIAEYDRLRKLYITFLGIKGKNEEAMTPDEIYFIEQFEAKLVRLGKEWDKTHGEEKSTYEAQKRDMERLQEEINWTDSETTRIQNRIENLENENDSIANTVNEAVGNGDVMEDIENGNALSEEYRDLSNMTDEEIESAANISNEVSATVESIDFYSSQLSALFPDWQNATTEEWYNYVMAQDADTQLAISANLALLSQSYEQYEYLTNIVIYNGKTILDISNAMSNKYSDKYAPYAEELDKIYNNLGELSDLKTVSYVDKDTPLERFGHGVFAVTSDLAGGYVAGIANTAKFAEMVFKGGDESKTSEVTQSTLDFGYEILEQSQDARAKLNVGLSTTEKIVQNAVISGIESAIEVAAFGQTGGSLTALGTRVFGQEMYSLDQEDIGSNYWVKFGTSLAKAGVEVIAESFFGWFGGNKIGLLADTDVLARAAGAGVGRALGKTAGTVATFALKPIFAGVSEGLEEVLSELCRPFIDAIRYSLINDKTYWENVEEQAGSDYLSSIFEAFATGALSGGGMSFVANTVNDISNKYTARKLGFKYNGEFGESWAQADTLAKEIKAMRELNMSNEDIANALLANEKYSNVLKEIYGEDIDIIKTFAKLMDAELASNINAQNVLKIFYNMTKNVVSLDGSIVAELSKSKYASKNGKMNVVSRQNMADEVMSTVFESGIEYANQNENIGRTVFEEEFSRSERTNVTQDENISQYFEDNLGIENRNEQENDNIISEEVNEQQTVSEAFSEVATRIDESYIGEMMDIAEQIDNGTITTQEVDGFAEVIEDIKNAAVEENAQLNNEIMQPNADIAAIQQRIEANETAIETCDNITEMVKEANANVDGNSQEQVGQINDNQSGNEGRVSEENRSLEQTEQREEVKPERTASEFVNDSNLTEEQSSSITEFNNSVVGENSETIRVVSEERMSEIAERNADKVNGFYDSETDTIVLNATKMGNIINYLTTVAHERTHMIITNLSNAEYKSLALGVKDTFLSLSTEEQKSILDQMEEDGYFGEDGYGYSRERLELSLQNRTVTGKSDAFSNYVEEFVTFAVQGYFAPSINNAIINGIKGEAGTQIRNVVDSLRTALEKNNSNLAKQLAQVKNENKPVGEVAEEVPAVKNPNPIPNNEQRVNDFLERVRKQKEESDWVAAHVKGLTILNNAEYDTHATIADNSYARKVESSRRILGESLELANQLLNSLTTDKRFSNASSRGAGKGYYIDVFSKAGYRMTASVSENGLIVLINIYDTNGKAIFTHDEMDQKVNVEAKTPIYSFAAHIKRALDNARILPNEFFSENLAFSSGRTGSNISLELSEAYENHLETMDTLASINSLYAELVGKKNIAKSQEEVDDIESQIELLRDQRQTAIDMKNTTYQSLLDQFKIDNNSKKFRLYGRGYRSFDELINYEREESERELDTEEEDSERIESIKALFSDDNFSKYREFMKSYIEHFDFGKNEGSEIDSKDIYVKTLDKNASWFVDFIYSKRNKEYHELLKLVGKTESEKLTIDDLRKINNRLNKINTEREMREFGISESALKVMNGFNNIAMDTAVETERLFEEAMYYQRAKHFVRTTIGDKVYNYILNSVSEEYRNEAYDYARYKYNVLFDELDNSTLTRLKINENVYSADQAYQADQDIIDDIREKVYRSVKNWWGSKIRKTNPNSYRTAEAKENYKIRRREAYKEAKKLSEFNNADSKKFSLGGENYGVSNFESVERELDDNQGNESRRPSEELRKVSGMEREEESGRKSEFKSEEEVKEFFTNVSINMSQEASDHMYDLYSSYIVSMGVENSDLAYYKAITDTLTKYYGSINDSLYNVLPSEFKEYADKLTDSLVANNTFTNKDAARYAATIYANREYSNYLAQKAHDIKSGMNDMNIEEYSKDRFFGSLQRKRFTKTVDTLTNGRSDSIVFTENLPWYIGGGHASDGTIFINTDSIFLETDLYRTITHESVHEETKSLSDEEYNRTISNIRDLVNNSSDEIKNYIYDFFEEYGYYESYEVTKEQVKDFIESNEYAAKDNKLSWMLEELITFSIEGKLNTSFAENLIDSLEGDISEYAKQKVGELKSALMEAMREDGLEYFEGHKFKRNIFKPGYKYSLSSDSETTKENIETYAEDAEARNLPQAFNDTAESVMNTFNEIDNQPVKYSIKERTVQDVRDFVRANHATINLVGMINQRIDDASLMNEKKCKELVKENGGSINIAREDPVAKDFHDDSAEAAKLNPFNYDINNRNFEKGELKQRISEICEWLTDDGHEDIASRFKEEAKEIAKDYDDSGSIDALEKFYRLEAKYDSLYTAAHVNKANMLWKIQGMIDDGFIKDLSSFRKLINWATDGGLRMDAILSMMDGWGKSKWSSSLRHDIIESQVNANRFRVIALQKNELTNRFIEENKDNSENTNSYIGEINEYSIDLVMDIIRIHEMKNYEYMREGIKNSKINFGFAEKRGFLSAGSKIEFEEMFVKERELGILDKVFDEIYDFVMNNEAWKNYINERNALSNEEYNLKNEISLRTIGKSLNKSENYVKMFFDVEEIMGTRTEAAEKEKLGSYSETGYNSLVESLHARNKGFDGIINGKGSELYILPITWVDTNTSNVAANAVGGGEFYQFFVELANSENNKTIKEFYDKIKNSLGGIAADRVKRTVDYYAQKGQKGGRNAIDIYINNMLNKWYSGVLGGNVAIGKLPANVFALSTWLAQSKSIYTANKYFTEGEMRSIALGADAMATTKSLKNILQEAVDTLGKGTVVAFLKNRAYSNVYEDQALNNLKNNFAIPVDSQITKTDIATAVLAAIKMKEKYGNNYVEKYFEMMNTQPMYDSITQGLMGAKKSRNSIAKLIYVFQNQRSTNWSRFRTAVMEFKANSNSETADNLFETTVGIVKSSVKIGLMKSALRILKRLYNVPFGKDKEEWEDYGISVAQICVNNVLNSVIGNNVVINCAYNVLAYYLGGNSIENEISGDYNKKNDFQKFVSKWTGVTYASSMFPGFGSTLFTLGENAIKITDNVAKMLSGERETDDGIVNLVSSIWSMSTIYLQSKGIPTMVLDLATNLYGSDLKFYDLYANTERSDNFYGRFSSFENLVRNTAKDYFGSPTKVEVTGKFNEPESAATVVNNWDELTSREQRALEKQGFTETTYNYWYDLYGNTSFSKEDFLEFCEVADQNGDGKVSREEGEAFAEANPEYEALVGDFFASHYANGNTYGLVTSNGLNSTQINSMNKNGYTEDLLIKYDIDKDGQFSEAERQSMTYEEEKMAVGGKNVADKVNPETGLTDAQYDKWEKYYTAYGMTVEGYRSILEVDNDGTVKQDDLASAVASGKVSVYDAWAYGMAQGWSVKNMIKKFGPMPNGMSTVSKQRSVREVNIPDVSNVETIELPNFNYNVDDLLIP